MKPLHLLITCKSSYRDFLPYCLASIDRFVRNSILTRHIVIDDAQGLSIPGYNIIGDQSLWQKFDPNFEYSSLFNEKWIMQQIFKFNCDLLVSGDVLIVDADLLFVKDMEFFVDDRYRLYLSHEYDPEYFVVLEKLLGIKKQTQRMQSFITDFAVFNTEILANLKHDIQKHTNMEWMDAVRLMLRQDGHNLSEFEIYGNYLLARYPDRVNDLIQPIDYIMRMVLDWKSYSHPGLIDKIRSCTDNYYQCVNIDADNLYNYS